VSKILDNTTGAPIDITDAGVTVDNVTDYTIPEQDYLIWSASADIITEINAGNIVVKNGAISLSAAEGVKYLEHPDQGRARISSNDKTSKHLFNKLVSGAGISLAELNDGADEQLEISSTSAIGALIPYVFVTTGNTSDKWLGAYVPSSFSNVVPLLTMQAVDVKGILFSNQDDDVDIDVELYKNGSLVYTWNVRNKRTAWLADHVSPFASFNQGDRVSCFLKKFIGGTGDSTAQDPVVELTLSTIGQNIGEGGTQFGV